jgi:coenzyme F420 hydrogenase subunit beta
MTLSNPTTKPARSLKRVTRGNLCAGCGACALAAPDKIEMTMVSPGYLRPLQTAPLEPQEDACIAHICPGLGQNVDPNGRTDDVLWGPFISMHTGFSTNPALRHTASSGGALSAVLVHLLESGAIDAVIQTAASPEVPIANVTVHSRTAAEVAHAAGSRYAPSAPLAGLGAQLDSTHRFAFVGKPCDVAALRALAKEDPRINARIPVMLAFFCAGVPSQTGAEKILESLGTDLASTTAFRYRGNGWPGRATARLKDGSEQSMSYFDSWGGILSNHVQLRCKVCADGTGKAADLVFADAWHSDENGYPLFEERDGVSLVVARTAQGAALLEEAQSAGKLAVQAFDPADLAAIQTGQSGRRRALFARLAGLRLLGRPVPRYRGLHVTAPARQNTLAANLKNFLGMIRRGLTGRLD